MTDISNKALSLLLLAAIVVSLSGTVLTFNKLNDQGVTGRAITDADTGKTNFSINSSLSIRFNNNLIPFGEGYVNDSAAGCFMGTNGSNPVWSNGCVGFNTTVTNANLTIENDGNIAANVSLNFSANATTFIGGTSPLFKYRVREVEAGSCPTARNASTFVEVGAATSDHTVLGSRICNAVPATDSSDLIDVGVWVYVPKNAATGAHTVTITALACDDAGSC